MTTHPPRATSPIERSVAIRHDWSVDEAALLLDQPLNDLLFRAQTAHRHHFDPNRIQVSTLLSIKTGACPEDCGYCSQSAQHETGLEREHLLPVSEVLDAARAAREEGATRFCMGAAWRNPTDKNLEQVIAMVSGVKALGLETCVTLGMLEQDQAQRLRQAGLDYYNHNLDTSPEFYGQVISTRTYQDRLQTLDYVREAGLKTCSGGILGMGESRRDRASMLCQLTNLPAHPESVPINLLVQVEGTPLFGTEVLDPFELVRTIAVARIMMPASYVRLSAGRASMSDELQALCFAAGANSVFYGDRLLTTDNAEAARDQQLFARLGLQPEEAKLEGRDQPGGCHKFIDHQSIDRPNPDEQPNPAKAQHAATPGHGRSPQDHPDAPMGQAVSV
ncbi:MAG: biotin synthase BioB [Lamprobacter sp.]|uniref:biotin synthase BioB n=1 Tax=Lamprobacter sp. TaxID=3100796 RepID=UPI002B259655|nr:biotin synthase BioB [Lamprobacter sp.]MEA3640688.1 biotin synthase BioB [Lamprobacter sp.]